jgi:hypothetical protein
VLRWFGILRIRVVNGSHMAIDKIGGPCGSPGSHYPRLRRCSAACYRGAGWWSGPSPGLCQSRRFCRDYERLCTTSEALIYAAMGRLMIRRLART